MVDLSIFAPVLGVEGRVSLLLHFAQLDLLPGLWCCENAGVEDPSYSKCSSNDGTYRCDKPVQRLSPLCVFHCDGAQVIPEPDRRDDAAGVAVGYVFLICHRVLVGVSLLAAHVLVHRGDNLQDVVVRGKGCAPGRKGEDTLALKERSLPTEQFKVQQVTKKGVSLLLISVTKPQLQTPHLCPLLRTLSGTWVTPEAAHHFCRTTAQPGFGLLEAS